MFKNSIKYLNADKLNEAGGIPYISEVLNSEAVATNADYYIKKVNDIIYEKLKDFCKNLLLDAVVRNRMGNPNAHQFTGNLINSIVVILFRKDTATIDNFFAYDDLKNPVRREMSARTARGTARKNAIHFRPDWQGTPHSKYVPEVVTDESTGPQDAVSFASSWSPVTGKDFEICVAYTSEYAGWVEMYHQSTGFMNSLNYTGKAMTSLGFKKVA